MWNPVERPRSGVIFCDWLVQLFQRTVSLALLFILAPVSSTRWCSTMSISVPRPGREAVRSSRAASRSRSTPRPLILEIDSRFKVAILLKIPISVMIIPL